MTTRVLKKSNGLVLEMTHMRRLVLLGLNQSAIEDACARLPGTLARLDEATWRALVPDELLNGAVKRSLAQRPPPTHQGALKASLRAHMRRLQHLPDQIRARFRAPTTAYAA